MRNQSPYYKMMKRKQSKETISNISLISDIEALVRLVKRRYAKNRVNGNNAIQCIISALRGPDRDDTSLKILTTARIRAIVCPHYFGEQRSRILTVDEMKHRDDMLEDCAPHFRMHYNTAVTAIAELYGYDLKSESPTHE